MAFTIDSWKRSLAQPVKSFVGAMKREGGRAASYGLYGGLCAAAFQPLMIAAQSGDPSQIGLAAIGVAGTVGGGLLANLAQ